jgi:hypothetical protein
METIIVALILTFQIGAEVHVSYEETFNSIADCVGYAIDNKKIAPFYSCEIVFNEKVY